MRPLQFPFTLKNGRYEVDRVFANSGGMGLLFEAKDTHCAHNRVLLKTTRYDSGRDARHFRYTMQEAIKHVIATRKILDWEKKVLVRFRDRGINNLPNPNDYFFDRSCTLPKDHKETHTGSAFSLPKRLLGSEPYLVMEFIAGLPLEDVMKDTTWRKSLEKHLLILTRELLTIFDIMHKPFEVSGNQGMFLYQDLKPANILVSDSSYFTLVDFGAVTLKLGARTTEPTAGCITTGYAAPEASHGRESQIDARFDLYTLGATLWHAVTLQDPRDLSGEFPQLDPMYMHGKGVSEDFVHMTARALATDPRKRYQSAHDMRQDVMRLLYAVFTSEPDNT